MIAYLKKKIDSKLVLILAVFYGITLTLSFVKLSYFKYNDLSYTEISWSTLFIDYFIVDYIAVMIFVVFAVYATKKMVDRKLSWKIIFLIHFLLSFLIGFFIYFGSALFFVLIGRFSLSQIDVQAYMHGIIRVLDINFLIYFSMVLIFYTFYYLKRVKQVNIEKSEIEGQLANAKLNLLKSNLQPHFLFNTLNSISTLVETNSKQAQNTIADLGTLLRELLDIGDKNLITLEKELDMLTKYINIIEVRFSDHFTFTSDIDTSLLKSDFPSLLLQPIVENCIKHGYDYDVTDLNVHLLVKKEDDRILISIANNGKALDKNFKTIKKNIGIKNTIERLKTIYNNDYQFFMKNRNGKSGVITNISIPYIALKES